MSKELPWKSGHVCKDAMPHNILGLASVCPTVEAGDERAFWLGPPGVTGPSGPVRTSAGSPEKPNACVYRKPHPVGARQNIYHRTEMIALMCFGKSPVRGCGAQNSRPRGLRFTIARSACPARNCEPSRMIEVFLHHPIASGRMITILSALVP